jgi:predicted GIY-YIG superfamily endonuclease
MYSVYILASRRNGTLYIGVTNSLRTRLEQHRSGEGRNSSSNTEFIVSSMSRITNVRTKPSHAKNN